ncbi:hypothetical protein O181_073252 [Austropuccinia psidii MF-1]|uniref:Uncharacterized protein n=1 Tax=Austropuccinia psidii MF-1 TaxID=1389203 RepID=A0A9Q3FAW8_9BASI|nr:hypothetical protein [Austropuccinia psidii MF-1]
MSPRLPLKCYYCLKKGHSAIICNHLTEDLEKRIFLKHGGTYLFPNFQRIPTEGPKSAKELVRHFAKEQEDLKKKMMGQSNPPTNKQEKTLIEERKGEKAATIAPIEEWVNWKPPQISPENGNLK